MFSGELRFPYDNIFKIFFIEVNAIKKRIQYARSY